MLQQQKRAVESLVRVQAFIEAHPIAGPVGYGASGPLIEDVVRRLREHAGAQHGSQVRSRDGTAQQSAMIRELVVQHIRPIVVTARTRVGPQTGQRLPEVLTMPPSRIGVTRMLQVCDGIIEAARAFEAAFIAHGLPADFLARFVSARNALEATTRDRATFRSAIVAASAGIEVEARRGRREVARLDAVVRAAFDGDQVTLAAWRAAKRLQHQPGRGGLASPEPAAANVAAPQAPASPSEASPHVPEARAA